MTIENAKVKKYHLICDHCNKSFMIDFPKNGAIIKCECGAGKIINIENEIKIMKAIDYIDFIKEERYDLITNDALQIIAKEFLYIKKQLSEKEDIISRTKYPDHTGR